MLGSHAITAFTWPHGEVEVGDGAHGTLGTVWAMLMVLRDLLIFIMSLLILHLHIWQRHRGLS